MKELSIEEKAKRYDEAIIRGSRLWESDMITRENYEYIFPEVKESKESVNEKIRKALIEMVHDTTDDELWIGYDIHKENALAWLEKKPSLLTKEKALKNSPFVEQKTADKIEPKFKAGDIIRHKEQGFTCKITAVDTEYRVSDCCGTHLPFDMQDYYELVEQKPAWSEEDDEMLDSIIEEVRYIGDFPDYPTKEENELYDECLSKVEWLKSLKDRVQPQSKQEWSEEDEKYSSYICAALDCYYRLREDRNNTNGQEDLDKARNWLYNRLKSLKPQNTWKPSELQIEALNRAMYHVEDDVATQIAKLIGDLKKLREK